MKKLNYLLLGAAGLILASCSNEEMVNPSLNPDGTANVVVTLSTPQIATRAYSDGKTATKLQFAVYEVKDGALSLIDKAGYYSENSETAADLKTIDIKKQMTFKLLTDHTYQFLFWAESADDNGDTNPYTLDLNPSSGNPTMTVDYSNVKANDENLDAFYGRTDQVKVTGNLTLDVPLYRPFAQVNIGTNDYEDAKNLGYEPAESSVVISKVYNKLDLLTDAVDGDAQVTFNYNAIDATQAFPVLGYEYLAMVYALVDKEQAVVDVTFNHKASGATASTYDDRKVGSVPVQRNHRTNIYGQVLTSDAELTIHIEPAYDDPDLEPSRLAMAAAIGGTVKLEEDVTEPAGYINVKKDFVLDLNGHSVTLEGEEGENVGFVVGTGNMTVVGNGELKSENGMPLIWANGGNVTIKGGNFSSENGHCIYVYSSKSKVVIEGGYFESTGEEPQWPINILDSQRDPGTPGVKPIDLIEVRGGTFKNFDPSNNASEGAGTNYVPAGYQVVETESGSDKLYTVVSAEVDAVVDSEEDLAQALADGKKIVMLQPGVYSDGLKALKAKQGDNGDFVNLSSEHTLLGYGATVENLVETQFNSYANLKAGKTKGATVKGFTFSKTQKDSKLCGEFYECNFINGVYSDSQDAECNFYNCTFVCDPEFEVAKPYAFHNGAIWHKTVMQNCVIDGKCDLGFDKEGELVLENCTISIKAEWGLYGSGKITFKNCKIAEGTADMIVDHSGGKVTVSWE